MKKILNKIGDWLRSTFKYYSVYEVNAKYAIQVVNALKTIANSNVLNVAVLLTKSPTDDKILNAAKVALEQAAKHLVIMQGTFHQGMTNEDIIKELVRILQTEFRAQQAVFYVQLAGLITQSLSDGKISLAEAITISQFIFSKAK